MAKLDRFFSSMLFLFATAIVTFALDPEFAKETNIAPESNNFVIPEPDYESALPTEPMSDRLKFLNECMSKISAECGEQAFKSLFQDSRVDMRCCWDLVEMGQPCHIRLVKTVFSFPEHKANATLGFDRAKRLWDYCGFEYLTTHWF